MQADVAFIGGDVDTAVRLHRRAWELAVSDDWLQAMWALGSVAQRLTYGGRLDDSATSPTKPLRWPTAAAARQPRPGLGRGRTAGVQPDPATGTPGAIEVARRRSAAGKWSSRPSSAWPSSRARQGDVDGALADCESLLAEHEHGTLPAIPCGSSRCSPSLAPSPTPLSSTERPSQTQRWRLPVAETTLEEAAAALRAELGDTGSRRLAAAGADLDESHVVAVAVEAIHRVTRN